MADVVGGPMDGERVEVRLQGFSLQHCAHGNVYARHRYRLVEKNGPVYVYVGIGALDYGNAGNAPTRTNVAANRRRR